LKQLNDIFYQNESSINLKVFTLSA